MSDFNATESQTTEVHDAPPEAKRVIDICFLIEAIS